LHKRKVFVLLLCPLCTRRAQLKVKLRSSITRNSTSFQTRYASSAFFHPRQSRKNVFGIIREKSNVSRQPGRSSILQSTLIHLGWCIRSQAHDIPQWVSFRSKAKSLACFESIPVRQCRTGHID
ncbi:uncharacterized protein K444DRAFT_390194, partial [Hyaloscypha bicolor E]